MTVDLAEFSEKYRYQPAFWIDDTELLTHAHIPPYTTVLYFNEHPALAHVLASRTPPSPDVPI